MRISGLAERTGVPVATVKYYLREGLLNPGVQTSATQARYDESHVARLRLVKALQDVGRLSISAIKQVIDCLEPGDVFAGLGAVQHQLPPAVPEDVDTTEADKLVGTLGWRVVPGSTAMRQLAVAMRAAEDVGLPLTPDGLATYADAAYRVAEREIAGMPQDSLASAITYAVVGTVLYEPILLALRRLAHQDVSGRLLAEWA
jgi:DNA-binding transcriptional MerR regulator